MEPENEAPQADLVVDLSQRTIIVNALRYACSIFLVSALLICKLDYSELLKSDFVDSQPLPHQHPRWFPFTAQPKNCMLRALSCPVLLLPSLNNR
jgi:hypothetical protein